MTVSSGGRTVVFDLDGTLADTSGDLIAAANACFERLGHPPQLERGRDDLTAFAGGRAMLRLGFGRLGMPPDEALVDAQYPVLLEAYGAAIATHTVLYPGAVDAVQVLRAAGFRTAICTNKPEGLARTLCDRLGISELFGALVGADTLAVRKPDAGHYRASVERAGGDVARSIMIGDTETDLLTARAVGAACVLVGFGPLGHGIARLGPDRVLDAYEALPAMVTEMLGED